MKTTIFARICTFFEDDYTYKRFVYLHETWIFAKGNLNIAGITAAANMPSALVLKSEGKGYCFACGIKEWFHNK
jgi:hypothetical protein